MTIVVNYTSQVTQALMIDGKSVLVTGGTGSLGKRFVRTVLERFRPKRVIVFSRDELKQSEMAGQLPDSRYPAIRYVLGDVRDRGCLEMAFQGVDIVVHAAALKQVPAAEYNPFECIQTNVLGAENVVRAAVRAGVSRVVALSTDKAVNPVSVYGASKLAADKIFVAANNIRGEDGPRFSIVRYGNVLGSTGSVIPFFLKLIRQKAAYLPLTDPAMTRFWIPLGQSAEFVLSCLEMMSGGEIFVPKIFSMKMADLASALAPNLPRKVVGIRPGEKLHESLIAEHEARSTAEMDDRFIILPAIKVWTDHAFDGLPRVAAGFTYTSDNDSLRLDIPAFLRMLASDSPLDCAFP